MQTRFLESGLVPMLTASQRLGIALVVSLCTALFYADSDAHAQFSFTDNFNRTTLGSNYSVGSTTGFGFTLDGSQFLLNKASGQTSGGINLTTNFLVVGDFTATVSVNRQAGQGSGSAGLGAGGTQTYLSDAYFFGSGQIEGNFFQPSFTALPVNDSSLSATFRIRRVGNTIFNEYSTGSEFVTINSRTDVSLGGATPFQLFLLEEENQGVAKQATFDNLSIIAQGVQGAVAPEPSSLVLIGMATLPFAGFAMRLRGRR